MALLLQLAADGFQFVLNAVAFPAQSVGLADLGSLVVEVGGQGQGFCSHGARNAGFGECVLSLLQVSGGIRLALSMRFGAACCREPAVERLAQPDRRPAAGR
jgi:hypothetical protein